MVQNLTPPAERSPVRRRSRLRPTLVAYALLLPTLALLGLFAYYPAFSGIFHSLFDWRPGFDSPFVGIDNYLALANDRLWWQSFRNLGLIFIFTVTVGWILPLLAAELLITLRGSRSPVIYRALLVAPMAFPAVVTVLLWQAIYHPNQGLLNEILGSIGLGDFARNWLGTPDSALLALLFIGFPFVAGLPFLVFLSVLQNIPTEIFEAAELDGAGRLRRLISIDLPLMASQLKLLIFLATISVLQYGFAAFLATGGGPDNATLVPVLRMLNVAFQGSDWGIAAAMATVLFTIALILSIVIVMSGPKNTKGADDER